MSNRELSAGRTSFFQQAVNAVWPFVSGRRGMILLALAVIAGGLALNWGVVVALGLAPLLLGILPCAAMCALGMCMRGSHSNCSSKQPGKEEGDA